MTAAARVETTALDLGVVRDALRAGRAPESWMQAWLEPAYADPERFLDSLYAFAAARRGAVKSAPGRPVDLYHDLVIAHLGIAKRAFVASERERRVELSYADLFARSGALAAAWHARGIEPGACVALVLPMGPDFVVALLAALRLGAVIGVIPPFGRTFVQNRLAALAPDALVVDPRVRVAIPEETCRVLPTWGGSESAAPPSHGYGADDPVLRLFPAFATPGTPLLEPVELAAGTLHAALLCDATVSFALERGDTLAAPGFDALAVQPTLLLCALMAGASFAEVACAELTRSPVLLAELGVTVLGVSPRTRDALLAHERWPKLPVRAWFRNLTEEIDFPRWDAFARRAARAGIGAFDTAYVAAAGGALVFGPARKEPPALRVWPVPGRAFVLAEVAGGLVESANERGVLVPLAGEDALPAVPRLVLSKEDAYVCSGTLEVGPGARAYPIDEVSAVLTRERGVRHASVVVSPGRSVNTANVTAIAFVEPGTERSPDAPSASSLTGAVVREMGEGYAPTRVALYPLHPRLGSDGIDHDWCRAQYSSGALAEKARREVFSSLARLGYLLETSPSDG